MARLTALAGGAAVALALIATPVAAHEHPSGITDLVTPAVVRLEAVSHVKITLLDHIGELKHVDRSYDLPFAAGTGTVVNPDGTIVALRRLAVNPDDVAVYAANKIFAEHHDVKIPADDKKHKLSDDLLDHHLQECYTPDSDTATCIVEVTTTITAFPNVSPASPDGYQVELVKAGPEPDSPAVLAPVTPVAGGVGMPTAPLADKVPEQEGAPTNVAGFLARPGPDTAERVEIAHLGKGGTPGETGRPFADPEKKADEPVKLGGLADKGLIGAPVIGDKDGHVIGLLIGGGDEGRMIGVKEVTAILAAAKVVPRRGAIDTAFEAALTRYHTKYYTEAAPGFQRVLELYPGNVVAQTLLKTSLAKRGGPEDQGTKQAVSESGGSMPLWPYVLAAGVLFVAAGGGAYLLWRRRAAEGPAEPPPPAAAGPPFDDAANQTVVVRRSQPFHLAPQQQQVMTAPDPAIKYCTSCGMRLGPAHRFCGYCGHPIET
ncbi:zinc ribbon domain-containing protein [Nonomuraea sp. MG754425]|uniref:zinc ribbon domain-containing protein n=1 Tax=Nonomuraea sp. MG754425 TaxID=2570319 RepID=UPI001F3B123B|nr:zinc ribbon domain-containing protein [Nonomuraea sp. MG754425]MCF6473602.1 zinc ribbon domain-containing protein [Nonomuraea sp. MG754425]